jgi:hypothetical protein
MSDAQADVRPVERHRSEGSTMTSTTNGHHVAVKDHAPIRCTLEMTEDCAIWVIVRPGCSVPDVHDMLRQLTLCEGHFQHVTIVSEDEELA